MSDARAGGHPIEAISALVDGELSPAERASVEAHVASCAACRELLEDIRRLALATPEAGIPEVPDGLAARIAARRDAAHTVRPRGRFVVPFAVAATLASVALVSTIHFRQARLASDLPPPGAPPSALPSPTSGPAAAPARAAPEAPPTKAAPETPPVELRRPAFGVAPPSTPAPAPLPRPADEGSSRDEDVTRGAAGGETGAYQPRSSSGERDAPEDLAAPSASPKAALKQDAVGFRGQGAFACPAPWPAPGEARWVSLPAPEAGGELLAAALDEGGTASAATDERGDFVTIRVPAGGWPGLKDRLRSLGSTLPPEPNDPPSGARCVVLVVRLGPGDPR
jgi:hypothetical protein